MQDETTITHTAGTEAASHTQNETTVADTAATEAASHTQNETTVADTAATEAASPESPTQKAEVSGNIWLKVKVDQAESLRRGVATQYRGEGQYVIFDLHQLTPEQRNYIADRLYQGAVYRSQNNAAIYLRKDGVLRRADDLLVLPTPDIEGLIEAVTRAVQEDHEAAVKADDETRKRLGAWMAMSPDLRFERGYYRADSEPKFIRDSIAGDAYCSDLDRPHLAPGGPEALEAAIAETDAAVAAYIVTLKDRQAQQERLDRQAAQSCLEKHERDEQERQEQLDALRPHLLPVEIEMMERGLLCPNTVRRRLDNATIDAVTARVDNRNVAELSREFAELRDPSQKSFEFLLKMEEALGKKGKLNDRAHAVFTVLTPDGREIEIAIRPTEADFRS